MKDVLDGWVLVLVPVSIQVPVTVLLASIVVHAHDLVTFLVRECLFHVGICGRYESALNNACAAGKVEMVYCQGEHERWCGSFPPDDRTEE